MRQVLETFTDDYGNPILKIYISSVGVQKRPMIRHRHTEFEISLILSGKGIYNTDLGDFEFSEGDIFIFSTNEYHNISAVLEAPFHILNIQFAPAFIYAHSGQHDILFMNIFLNRTAQFRNLLTRDNPHTEQIRQKFLSIQNECEQKEPCYYTKIRNNIMSILIDIFRYYNYADYNLPSSRVYNDINNLQKAIAFIDTNYNEEVSLEDIATSACLSKFHFMRLFKSTYNMTVWDYINIKRINKAISLLKTTNDTVINIASKSGFNSPANFNRIFKKITGLTPKEYRRHLKQS